MVSKRTNILFSLFFLLLGSSLQAQVMKNSSFSQQRGLFEEAFTLTITPLIEGANIRYTLDASTPSLTEGTLYSGPIDISETTLLRAIAWNDTDTSRVYTQSYIFPQQVISQFGVPTGYPDEFVVGELPADYDMDPEVTQDPAYSEMMLAAMYQIPSMSIVTDKEHLFSLETGIYMNPLEDGVEWERPTSLELLSNDGSEEGFDINAGMRMYGNSSRDPFETPKHSFRFLFKDIYGKTKLDYPLFGDDATDKFDTFILRAGFNFSWVTDQDTYSQRERAAYIRDQFARELQNALGYTSSHGRYVHLYINGIYWGLYNPVERPDGAFAAEYFGGDKEDYDVLNSAFTVGESSDSSYLAMIAFSDDNDLSNQTAYEEMLTFIDINEWIDYIVLNHYIGNFNWDSHNWYAARKREVGEVFHFFSWDSESSFHLPTNTAVDTNNEGKPTGMHFKMMENLEYRVKFSDHIHQHFFNCGLMTPDSVTGRWGSIASKIDTAIVGESARWGDYRRDITGNEGAVIYTKEVWETEKSRLYNDLFPIRTENVLGEYLEFNLYPGTKAPVYNEACDQAVPSGFIVNMSNPNDGVTGDIYFTTDNSDPRLLGGAIANTATLGGDSFDLPITETTTVRSRVKNGDEWSAMQVTTYYIEAELAEALVINEIMYNPIGGNDFEFIELKNLSPTSLNLSDAYFSDGIEYTFPTGATIPANGFVILASNFDDFVLEYGFEPNGIFIGKLANSGENIALRDPLGVIIDEVNYLDETPWDSDPDGLGTSLEFIVDADNNSLPQNWLPSAAMGGSPLAENGVSNACTFSNPYLVINEINYNSSPTVDAGDWVELYNPTALPIDLTNWEFQDEGNTYEMPSGTIIPANGYLVLVTNDTLFQNIFPDVSNYLAPIGLSLAGNSERIRLVNAEGCLVDKVIYEDLLPWPIEPDGTGPTLELIHPILDNELPASWQVSIAPNGTPGSGDGATIFVELGDDLTVCDGEEVTLNATVAGCTFCVYTWSNGANTPIISFVPNMDMTINVTVSDGVNNVNDAININLNPSIALDANPNSPACFGDTNGFIDLNPSGGSGDFEYIWNTGSTSEDINNLAAGDYEVTVTDDEECTEVQSFTLSEPNQIVASGTVSDAACFNGNTGSIDLGAGGGIGLLTYLWSNEEISQDISGLESGSYTVTISDNNNCTRTETFEVGHAPEITYESSTQDLLCNGDETGMATALLSGGTGNLNILWNTNEDTETIENLAAGEYTFVATDGNNCQIEGSVEVTSPAPIVIGGLAIPISCGNTGTGAVNLEVEGGTGEYNYEWSTEETTQNISGLNTGDFTVVVTDGNNCQSSNTFTVGETDGLFANGIISNISCFGLTNGTINLEIEGGTNEYIYTWDNGEMTQSLSELEAGEYAVTVEDTEGCSTEEVYIITEPTELSSMATETNVTCFGIANGSIDFEIEGGSNEFTYSWDNGAETEDISDLLAGEYSVVVTDTEGCTIEGTYIITEPTELTSSAVGTDPEMGTDGSIEVTPDGGTEPYEILWNTGATDFLINMLEGGDYSYELTDANGCVTNGTVTLMTVGLNEIQGLEQFSLSPNPNNGQFNVLIELNTEQEFLLEVVNVQGQILHQEAFKDSYLDKVFNTSDLAAGIYFLRLKGENGVGVLRFIKE